MGHKEWKMPTAVRGDTGLEAGGYTTLLSRLLRARGIETPEQAALYLARDSHLLLDPFLLTDMDKAVSRIARAEKRGEKIAIYGDYDVDGITSSCMLCDFFRRRGLTCQVYIPDRLDEGYGLNPDAVRALSKQGIGLIITVDCGITAFEEAELARSLGMDIIITDHHECPALLPRAAAVINPKRQDSAYPFDALAGVGVAFKLLCAIEGESEALLECYSDIVAVGTVADVMPLVGENRALVYAGLQKLKTSPRPGFAALFEEAGAAQKPISASIISFVLAPRINAAGRLCQTETSVSLLLAEDAAQAQACAKELCELNRRRQELETKVWDDAMAQLDALAPTAPIVLQSELWHPGVVGIAASRLAEAFSMPTIVICMDGDTGKGSCRSFGDFNLFDALSSCSEYLESFGGHAFAAGLSIKQAQIEDFCRALAEYYRQNPPAEHPALSPELELSDFSCLTISDVLSLDELEPCGSGNPKPLMCICDVRLTQLSPIGGGKHLRMRVSKDGESLDCVFFSHSPQDVDVSEGELIDLCFAPQINDFRSVRSVQLLVSDVRPAKSETCCREILQSRAGLAKMREYRPRREELITVWHRLSDLGGHFSGNICDCAMQGSRLLPETLCLCLKIFCELGLISLSAEGDKINVRVNTGAEKNALDNSPLFRSLWQGAER